MMHNPPHPGEVLREDVIAALGLSVTEAADRLAMSRVALSRVLNGKAGISPDLAVRLEQAGAGTAQAWVAMQANYDLWQALQHAQPPVRPL
ncbi:HigA family addiction module antidote protein, partial [Streptomyces sp. AC04842]|nr:HigA family addiction module antidote protein [Streptomyces sp. AC04842]